MANICSTTYQIFRSAEDGGIRPLYDALEAAIGEDRLRGSRLSNIVEKCLGEDPKSGKYGCRGDISNIELADDGEMQVDVDSAWTPYNKMWIDLVEKYVPGALLLYYAEECGCDLFRTNDPDYDELYYLDRSDNGDINPCADEEDIREVASEVTGKDASELPGKIDDVIDLLDEEYGIFVHSWEYNPDMSNAE